jgi:beta propeller repeat protein
VLYFDPFSNDDSDVDKTGSTGPVELKPNEPFKITNDPANQERPAIYGDRIVWQDDRNGNWDIYMFDLSTGKERQITSDIQDQVEPDIFGDVIVWKETRNHVGIVENYPIDYNSDIYIFDLRTNKEEPLIINEFCQFSPKIFDQTIIWLDYRNGQADVFMYDLSTNVEKKVSTQIGNCTSNNVNGDFILWQSSEAKVGSIFKYQISTGQLIEIDQIKADNVNDLNFLEDIIVWHSTPEKDINSDIFMYQTSKDIITQITTNESFQYQPILSESDIFWTDLRNDPDGWDCGCGGNDPSGAEDFVIK